MKRKHLFFLFFLSSLLYSQNINLDGKYRCEPYGGLNYFILNNKNIQYDFENELIQPFSNEWNIFTTNGVTFLHLSEKFPKEGTEFFNYNKEKFSGTDDRILILCGKISNRKLPILLTFTKGFENNISITNTILNEEIREYKNCTSYLKEKSKDYPPENLCDLGIDTPWVEGVSGDGIGEGFSIINSWGTVYPYLLLMNGYISYEKPYLYKQNNRIKKIKVTGLKSGNSKVLDVLDTSHPQTVDISFITEPEDIRVEIADVYKGTKYDDTCLHYCITYDDEVIPYKNSIEE